MASSKKDNFKLITIIFGAIIIVLIVIIFILLINLNKKIDNKNNGNNGVKPTTTEEIVRANSNADVIKDQKVGEFSFSNTSLIYQNKTSTLTANVTNTSNVKATLEEFKIHVLGKDGKEIIELTGFIGDSLEPGETRSISSSYGEDLSNAAKITYEVVK